MEAPLSASWASLGSVIVGTTTAATAAAPISNVGIVSLPAAVVPTIPMQTGVAINTG